VTAARRLPLQPEVPLATPATVLAADERPDAAEPPQLPRSFGGALRDLRITFEVEVMALLL